MSLKIYSLLYFNKNKMRPVKDNPNSVILNEYSLIAGIKSEIITNKTVNIKTVSGKKYWRLWKLFPIIYITPCINIISLSIAGLIIFTSGAG